MKLCAHCLVRLKDNEFLKSGSVIIVEMMKFPGNFISNLVVYFKHFDMIWNDLDHVISTGTL